MPASDLQLNVRQLAGYPDAGQPWTNDAILIQRGLGGPYLTLSPAALVSSALAQGGDMSIGGQVSALAIQAGAGQFSNLASGLLGAQKACIVELDATWGSIGGVPIATQADVANAAAVLQNLYDTATVQSFNGRRGDVRLWLGDILCAGGAPIFSPRFEGQPRAITPAPWSNTTRLATTAFVQRNSVLYIDNLLKTHPFVFSFNGRTGAVTLTGDDLAGATGLLDNANLTGVPTAPTPPAGTDTNQVATTAFVHDAIETALTLELGYAPLNSPNFSGLPTAPTAAPGNATGQLATTAFVMTALSASVAGVSSFNTRTGAVVLTTADITGAGGAPLASPALTGTPTAPTATAGNSSTQLATTAFVANAITALGAGVASFNTRTGAVVLQGGDITGAGGALLTSPAFGGTPTAPTASVGTNTTQIATTAFVTAAMASAAAGVASFNGRTGAVSLIANDISAAGGAVLNSPGFTGVPTAPTAAVGTNTAQIATTAFVETELSANAVRSFNTRVGAVTLTGADITSAGGALLAGPAFTGAPTAPTAAVGTSTTQLATTAFVAAAIAGSTAGVSSFNGRTGTVTLQAADVTSAGGALIASPIFTGTPSGPTAVAGTSTAQLATTAFVQAALAASGVSSFNGRTGGVTLIANDISAAGGALTASPALTGVPTAPTATPGTTNTTQIATTAFVQSAIAATNMGVTTFNTRTGAVTLTAADVTATGALTINNTARFGTTTATQSMFAANGNLGVGWPTFPSNASLGHIILNPQYAAGGPFITVAGGSSTTTNWAELNLGLNVYSDGTNWRYLTAGGATVLWLGIDGGMAYNWYPTGAAGAVLGAAYPMWGVDSNGNMNVAAGLNAPSGGAIFGGTITITQLGNQLSMGGGASVLLADASYYGVGESGPVTDTQQWRYMFQRNSGDRYWYGWGGVQNMRLTGSGSLVTLGPWSQASDMRGKRDIRPAAEGLDALRKITPQRFRRIRREPPKEHPGWAAPDREELGFIAQNVQAALPDAVETDGEGMLSVAAMPLIAMLVNAVKQLDARLAALEPKGAT